MTIDKYVYVVVSSNDGQPSQVTSSADFTNLNRTNLRRLPDTDLAVPRAVLNHFEMFVGCSVFVAMQVPSDTGLGTATASGIALACGLAALNHSQLNAHRLADLIAFLEIEVLKRPVGRQDHYAIALGGLTVSEFTKEGVSVRSLLCSESTWRGLEARLMLFYTGRAQDMPSIWAEQKKGTERNRASVIESLHIIRQQSEELIRHIEAGRLDAVGPCLDASWHAQKNLARNVTDAWIDQWYETALSAGASGGKICGAGGGGFLLLACEVHLQDQVTEALEAAGLSRVHFRFERGGASVISQRESMPQKAKAESAEERPWR